MKLPLAMPRWPLSTSWQLLIRTMTTSEKYCVRTQALFVNVLANLQLRLLQPEREKIQQPQQQQQQQQKQWHRERDSLQQKSRPPNLLQHRRKTTRSASPKSSNQTLLLRTHQLRLPNGVSFWNSLSSPSLTCTCSSSVTTSTRSFEDPSSSTRGWASRGSSWRLSWSPWPPDTSWSGTYLVMTSTRRVPFRAMSKCESLYWFSALLIFIFWICEMGGWCILVLRSGFWFFLLLDRWLSIWLNLGSILETFNFFFLCNCFRFCNSVQVSLCDIVASLFERFLL